MGRIIRSDGRQETVFPAKGDKFSLEEMQAVVGGFIEVLRLPSGDFLVLNEEGKLYHLPTNPAATLLGRAAGIADDDFVVGDCLVCSTKEMGEDEDES